MNDFSKIIDNKVLWITILAWVIAQVLKVIIHMAMYKHMDFSRFIGAGGMPSSHSALVTSLATSIGMLNGFDSNIFALALTMALVIMYDASGVRRAAGKQAKVLNKIIDQFRNQDFNIEERLKELLGHTPVEVLAGALLGVVVAILLN